MRAEGGSCGATEDTDHPKRVILDSLTGALCSTISKRSKSGGQRFENKVDNTDTGACAERKTKDGV